MDRNVCWINVMSCYLGSWKDIFLKQKNYKMRFSSHELCFRARTPCFQIHLLLSSLCNGHAERAHLTQTWPPCSQTEFVGGRNVWGGGEGGVDFPLSLPCPVCQSILHRIITHSQDWNPALPTSSNHPSIHPSIHTSIHPSIPPLGANAAEKAWQI